MDYGGVVVEGVFWCKSCDQLDDGGVVVAGVCCTSSSEGKRMCMHV